MNERIYAGTDHFLYVRGESVCRRVRHARYLGCHVRRLLLMGCDIDADLTAPTIQPTGCHAFLCSGPVAHHTSLTERWENGTEQSQQRRNPFPAVSALGKGFLWPLLVGAAHALFQYGGTYFSCLYMARSSSPPVAKERYSWQQEPFT